MGASNVTRDNVWHADEVTETLGQLVWRRLVAFVATVTVVLLIAAMT